MATEPQGGGDGGLGAARPDLVDGVPWTIVGRRLRNARRRRGLSRAWAATDVGVSRADLAAYERGRKQVPESVLMTLLDRYGIPLDKLLPSRRPVTVGRANVIVGRSSRALPDTRSEDDVLVRYLDMVRELRDVKPGAPIPLREDDLSALADALGREPATIEARLVDLIECSDEEAAALRAMILRRRVVAPATKLALGTSSLGIAAGVADVTPVRERSRSVPDRSTTVPDRPTPPEGPGR